MLIAFIFNKGFDGSYIEKLTSIFPKLSKILDWIHCLKKKNGGNIYKENYNASVS